VRNKVLYILFLFIGITFYSFNSPFHKTAGMIAIVGETKFYAIVNKSAGLPEKELSIELLKKYLKGDITKWSNKSKVNLALMKSSSPLGKEIASAILNMTPIEYDKFYLSMVFQGKITAPKMFSNESDLQTYVSGLSGTIGVITAKEAEQNKGKLADVILIPIN